MRLGEFIADLDRLTRDLFLPGEAEDPCCTVIRHGVIDKLREALGLPAITDAEWEAAWIARQRARKAVRT